MFVEAALCPAPGAVPLKSQVTVSPVGIVTSARSSVAHVGLLGTIEKQGPASTVLGDVDRDRLRRARDAGNGDARGHGERGRRRDQTAAAKRV